MRRKFIFTQNLYLLLTIWQEGTFFLNMFQIKHNSLKREFFELSILLLKLSSLNDIFVLTAYYCQFTMSWNGILCKIVYFSACLFVILTVSIVPILNAATDMGKMHEQWTVPVLLMWPYNFTFLEVCTIFWAFSPRDGVF